MTDPRSRRASAALAAAFAAALVACAKAPEAPPMFERPPAPVRVVAAVARDVPVYLDEIGRVAAVETVTVRPQVTGLVTDVRFTEGADVRKGDVLVTLDARPFQARLDAAEAALLRARAMLLRAQTSALRPRATLERARAARDLAKTEFARAGALLATKAVSQADYDARGGALAVAEAEVLQAEADVRQAEPDEAQAQAEVKAAEADVAAAAIDLGYCTIRAPIDGRAGRRLVDAGNVVSANGPTGGGAALVVLDRIDSVHVDFSVAEKEVLRVQRNLAAGALAVEVRLPEDPAAPCRGTLTFVENSVDPGTGTLGLRATLPNPDRRLWPGRFVQVRLVLATLPAAVLVPADAEQLAPTGPFAYVVTADGTAEMRPSVFGQHQGDLVVVTQGVRAGESVVVAGQFAVTPGGKVRVVEDAPPVTAPAPGAAPAPATGTGERKR